ncbi:MAG: TonB-dependent receptor [Sphingomonadales bacterium]|nr:TonB-dependent receptor [Sphingomonadales bacterium]
MQGERIADIVVTAQRREEAAQRAALSLAVLDGKALRAQGVDELDDLPRLMPGLRASGQSTQLYIRGIGDFTVLASANPAVITNLDGVVIGRSQGIGGNLFDLARIEVLKGPQGTLYGRNASGGAINLVTHAPEPGRNGGFFEASFGDHGQLGGEGAVNLALGTDAALRASFQVQHRDGYLSDGTADDIHEGARLQFAGRIGSGLALRLAGGFSHLGGKGIGFAVVPTQPGIAPWTGVTSSAAGAAYMARAAAIFAASGGQSLPPALLASPAETTPHQDVRAWYVQGQLDAALGFATLTLQPGYRQVRTRYVLQPSFRFNLGGIYDAAGDATDGDRSRQLSIELRLANRTPRLTWVVGGNLFSERLTSAYAIQAGPVLNGLTATTYSTRAGAVFGQATFAPVERLRLTGGVRYTIDRREARDYRSFAISPMVLGPVPSPADCVPANGKAPGTLCPMFNPAPGFYDSAITFRRATWKLGAEFDIAPQSLAFVEVSAGFKAGGFSQAVDFAPNDDRLAPFAPERVTAYTLGLRNRLLGDRLQVNVEGFYLDNRDLQVSAQAIDGLGATAMVTQNAGKARVAGFGLDVVALPWAGATLHGAVEFADARYDSYVLTEVARFVPPGRVGCPVSAPDARGLVRVDCSGRQMLLAPRWSGVVNLAQAIALRGDGRLTLSADVSFASGFPFRNDFIATERQRAYANLGAAIAYAAGARWQLSVYVRNITDRVIYTGGGEQSALVQGWVTSNVMPPRTFGGRLSVRF